MASNQPSKESRIGGINGRFRLSGGISNSIGREARARRREGEQDYRQENRCPLSLCTE